MTNKQTKHAPDVPVESMPNPPNTHSLPASSIHAAAGAFAPVLLFVGMEESLYLASCDQFTVKPVLAPG
jgi:hypothetical protein